MPKGKARKKPMYRDIEKKALDELGVVEDSLEEHYETVRLDKDSLLWQLLFLVNKISAINQNSQEFIDSVDTLHDNLYMHYPAKKIDNWLKTLDDEFMNTATSFQNKIEYAKRKRRILMKIVGDKFKVYIDHAIGPVL